MNTKILRKLIYGFAFVAITAIAAVNLNMNANKYGFSDRQLANVEVLAQQETNKQYEIKDVKQLEIWDEEDEIFVYMYEIFCVGKGNLDCP